MRFLFVTFAPLRQGPAGPTSDLASARYRVLIPARQLTRLDHEVQVASLPPGGWPDAVTGLPCDVLVVSKSFHAANEKLAATMKARGVRIIVDLCDDHFAHPEYGGHFRRLAGLADQVVASTQAMAESILRHTGRDSIVISDPVEGPRGAPKFAPQFPALRLAWFGHPSNLNGLAARISELQALAARMPVRLSVVTAPTAGAAALVASLAPPGNGQPSVELVSWSTDATWKALENSDAVWIPVIDSDRLVVRYDSAFALMHDLRRMGATNALTERRRTPLKRATLKRMAEIYAEKFADADGRLRASFEIIWLSGWAPHESQQQPLKPGSAMRRLADALGTKEISTGEKPGS